MSKFFRNVRKCVCTARNDSYTIHDHKYITVVHQRTHNINIRVHSGFSEGVQHPEKCTNSSEMSVNVSIQLEMTHILYSTTNISLLYTSVLILSIYRCTVGFLEGVQRPEKCTNSSEMSVNVSVQLEMTHILSSTTNISLLYTSVLILSIYTQKTVQIQQKCP